MQLITTNSLTFLLALFTLTQAATPTSSSPPGYYTTPPSPPNSTLSFGQHYAVLNLDLQELIASQLRNDSTGARWINATATWINTVHAQDPAPLSIFSRIAPVNSRLADVGGPVLATYQGLNVTGPGDPRLDIAREFKVRRGYDVVVDKTRYYAGMGNALEVVLDAQGIDTVIISGVRTSGVVLATASRLIDLDYTVYVILETCIEPSPSDGLGPLVDRAIKQGILPKIPANVISLAEAIAALKRSGPAIY